MSKNNDSNRPEDNPFIAFRRFADSQVSSILNTVFTLPATLANYNNAHQAREKCLFGKADKQECDKLHQIEGEIAKLRDEGRESYRVGDLQAVLAKSEELLLLTQRADHVRRGIIENTAVREDDRHGERALVEKVANEKGQQWGDSWDWDIPKRDEDADEPDLFTKMVQMEAQMKRFLFGERGPEMDPKRWTDQDGCRSEDDRSRMEGSQPRVSSWLWQWPSPGDTLKREAANSCRLQDVFDELDQVMQDEARRMMRHSTTPKFSDPYSPQSLSQNPAMKKAGVDWQAAYDDLLRFERQPQPANLRQNTHHPPSKQHQYPKRVPWEDEETSEDPAYEKYAHDHEDQHDEPQFPKAQQPHLNESHEHEQNNNTNNPDTELDFYERLLTSSPHTVDAHNKVPSSSILSTMTTTERTVAPDGSVTTKIMLKKRFADGREESSETVHTQRGEVARETWREGQESAAQKGERNVEKKKGWFWSG